MCKITRNNKIQVQKWFVLCCQTWPFAPTASLLYNSIKKYFKSTREDKNMTRGPALLTEGRLVEQLTAARGGVRRVGGRRWEKIRSNRRERGEKRRRKERTKERKQSQARAAREKEGREKSGARTDSGAGTEAHWHLGLRPSSGLCGPSNDWCKAFPPCRRCHVKCSLADAFTSVTHTHTLSHILNPSSHFWMSEEPQSWRTCCVFVLPPLSPFLSVLPCISVLPLFTRSLLIILFPLYL